MLLFDLPLCIRDEIIDSVIEDYPNYCQLNKECLIRTVRRHGITILQDREFNTDIRIPYYTIYNSSLWFRKIKDINWDSFKSYKGIQKVIIEVDGNHDRVEHFEFVNKLLSLSPLKIIRIHADYDGHFLDFFRFLFSQFKLKELQIPENHLNLLLNFKSHPITFPVLNKLIVTNVKTSFDIKRIVEKIPNLKSLELNSYKKKGNLPSFGDQIIPYVKELVINYYHRNTTIKLDLFKWPNLKILTSTCPIEFTNLNSSFTFLRTLSLVGTSDYLSTILSVNFINLTNLSLRFTTKPSDDLISQVFNLCTRLTTLELTVEGGFELPKTLPAALYTVTDLALKGRFSITSNLLHWLSNNFKLKILRLKRCYIKEDTHLEKAPFSNLNRLEIYTQDHLNSQPYFNRAIYPNINYIIIGKSCESCSFVKEHSVEKEINGEISILRPVDYYLETFD